MTVLPWRKNIAWVPGNLHVDGKPWPFCPRTHPVRQLEQARKQGYIFNVGIEPEFMLLKKNATGEYAPWDRSIPSASPATTCARCTAIWTS